MDLHPEWVAVVASAVTAIGVGLDKLNYYRQKRSGTNMAGRVDKLSQKVDRLTNSVDNFTSNNDADHARLEEKVGALSGEVHELKGYIRGRANGSI